VTEKLKFIVAGAAGRMGRTLINLIAQDPASQLVGAIEAPAHSALGVDAGEVAGCGRLSVALSSDYAQLASPDTVTLDFSSAHAALEHLEAAVERGAAIVIGATGFTPEMNRRLHALAPRTRTLVSPNMSVGVNVLLKIAAEVAAALPDFDVEITELHHRFKADAPSGTALALGRAVAQARARQPGDKFIFGREGVTGERPQDQVAILALRAGDVVGDHTVLFGGRGERLELIHRSQSRDSFAQGALRAARWLAEQKPGLYSMRDVLGF
jgi:4-hydroxy-tetrahydrodipicolinate reductase